MMDVDVDTKDGVTRQNASASATIPNTEDNTPRMTPTNMMGSTTSSDDTNQWRAARAQSKMANYSWMIDDAKYSVDFKNGNMRLGRFDILVSAKALRRTLKGSAQTEQGVGYNVVVDEEQDQTIEKESSSATTAVAKCRLEKGGDEGVATGAQFILPKSLNNNKQESFHMVLQSNGSKHYRLLITKSFEVSVF